MERPPLLCSLLTLSQLLQKPAGQVPPRPQIRCNLPPKATQPTRTETNGGYHKKHYRPSSLYTVQRHVIYHVSKNIRTTERCSSQKKIDDVAYQFNDATEKPGVISHVLGKRGQTLSLLLDTVSCHLFLKGVGVL